MKPNIAVASYDGDGYANNVAALIQQAEGAGLKASQFDVRRADDAQGMSNYDHRVTLYVTEAGKKRWDERTNPYLQPEKTGLD